jgi:hypothetical protein
VRVRESEREPLNDIKLTFELRGTKAEVLCVKVGKSLHRHARTQCTDIYTHTHMDKLQDQYALQRGMRPPMHDPEMRL